MSGKYVTEFLQLRKSSNLENLDNVTYDTLVNWTYEGWQMYEDRLQTTWPDLTRYQASSGKVLHHHGESDFGIATASIDRYYESIRSIMYPGASFNDSGAMLSDWYRLSRHGV